uniref:Uncharacterized protein n=1 Tax=Oryza nivara TaxID=4536 RepID=A0A0E0HFX6_ORYNI
PDLRCSSPRRPRSPPPEHSYSPRRSPLRLVIHFHSPTAERLTGKESPSQILQGGGTAYSAWCRRPSLSIHRHRLPFSERVQILPIDPISVGIRSKV